ncbi:MAG: hypothetical protein D6694_11785 [Gammaproteobacteria bacterium]|nr:MAG: hypothetical protein D6694_11785 [Gammaproteobacteria bacterium]
MGAGFSQGIPAPCAWSGVSPAVARGAVPVAGLRWWVLAVATGWQVSIRAVVALWGAPFARRGLVGAASGGAFGGA